MLKVEQPIERGLIRDWDSMEKIWNHLINNELKTSIEEHPVMMTESPLTPKQHRERMT